MERDDPNYRLEIIPRWTRKIDSYVKCPTCDGSGNKCPFSMWGDDEEQDKRCEKCHGRGVVLVDLPSPAPIDPAFLWYMSNAFRDFWARQPEIQAAYALKKAHEDSLNSSGL